MLGKLRLFNAALRNKLLLFARSIETNELMENFAIASVSTIFLVRLFLKFTGYPQLGGAGLHIAHMLWGGLFMVLALIVSLTFLNKEARRLSALLGGIGFGLFIDEIGKFVTHDNNYFYEPTFVLIYLVFVALFFILRFLVRTSELTEKEYAMNALETMKEVIYYDLDEDEMKHVRHYLAKSDPKNPVVVRLKDLLANYSPMDSHPDQSFVTSAKHYFKNIYVKWFRSQLGIKVIAFTYIVMSVMRFILALRSISWQWNFWAWGRNISSVLVFLFVLQGLNFQRRGDRLNAFREYRKAAIISILLVQVFDFYYNELSALLFLTVSIVSYVTVQYVIEIERHAHHKS